LRIINDKPSFPKGFSQPGEITDHKVWLHRRFALTYRKGEQVLASCGVDVA